MAKVLAQLLDQPEVLVESAIKKLENLSGFNSTDVRLLADINNRLRIKTTQLGLDPDDTTGPELYHALLVKLAHDEANINLSPENLVEKMTRIYKPYKVYALKSSVAKEILRKNPPRNMMKQLNYRSIDSMLKREVISELFAGLQLVESARWIGSFWKDLTKLTPSDFEPQKIAIVTMPTERWEPVRNDSFVTNDPLLGTINIWPNRAGIIALGVQVARNFIQLRTTCTYIKLRQVEPDFAKQLVEVLRGGLSAPAEISHLPISWQTIFGHYGKRSAREHTEFFGPLLLHEDIKTPQSLIQASPVFRWWQDLEHVAKRTSDGLVSLNLSDVLDSRTSASYKQRSQSHSHGALWRELIDRYMAHSSIEAYLMNQLNWQPALEYEFSNSQPHKSIKDFTGVI